MKKQVTKWISVILTVCMMLSMLSVAALADSNANSNEGTVVYSTGFEDNALILNSGISGTSSYDSYYPAAGSQYGGNSGGAIYYELSSTEKRSGSNSLRIAAARRNDDGTYNYDAASNSYYGIPFVFDVDGDSYYTFKCYLKLDRERMNAFNSGAPNGISASGSIRLGVQPTDNSYTTNIYNAQKEGDYAVTDTYWSYIPMTKLSDSEWTEMRIVFKVTGNKGQSKKAKVLLSQGGWLSAGGQVFFFADDIELRKVEPSVSINGFPENGKILVGSADTTVTFGDASDENRLTKTYVGSERLLYEDAAATLSLVSAPSGVTFENNVLTVSKDAEGGKAIIRSVGQSGLTADHNIVIDKPAAPVAENVKVSGKYAKGETLTGSYVFSDINGDSEQGTTFKWYRAVSADGTDKTAIENASGTSYTLTSEDVGKYIFFGVTPATAVEPKIGVEVISSATEKIGKELVDVIIVSGQSNSVSGSVAASETAGNVKTEAGKVFVFEGGTLKDAQYGAVGFMVPLGIRYNELTGKKTVMLCTGKSGMGIEYFIDEGEGKTYTISSYDSLKQVLEDNEYKMDKKLAFWLQGEGNCATQADDYSQKFTKLLTQWQADDALGKLDLFGVLMNRAWIDTKEHNTASDLLMTGPRQVYYSIDTREDSLYDNVKLVSCITDGLVTDTGVKTYFEGKYGSTEAFKAKFGYDMPQTAESILYGTGNNRGHYYSAGYNEMGIDAAENAVAYLEGRTPVSEIKVLDETGTEIADNASVDLSKWYAGTAAYTYPVGAKANDKITCTITKNGEAYTNVVYDGATGMFIQRDFDDDANGITAQFKCGSVTKTVTLKLADKTTPRAYAWLTSGEETNLEYYKASVTADNNFVQYPYVDKIENGKLKTANYPLQFKDRIYLPLDSEWEIGWKGQFSSLEHIERYYERFIFAGDELGYANYENAFRVFDGGIRFNLGRTAGTDSTCAVAYFSEIDSAYGASTYSTNIWEYSSDSFKEFASESAIWSIKNVKENDGTYQMYFCKNGVKAKFRTKDGGAQEDPLKSYSEHSALTSNDIMTSKGIKKLEITNAFANLYSSIEGMFFNINSDGKFSIVPTVNANGAATVTFANAYTAFDVVAATYSGDSLANAKFVKVTAQDIANGSIQIDLSDFELNSGEKITFFAWDDMTPLTEKVEVTVQ